MKDRVKPILAAAILVLLVVIGWTSNRLHKISSEVAAAETAVWKKRFDFANERADRAQWELARVEVELLACQGQKASGMNVPVQKLPEWDERHDERTRRKGK